MTGNLTVKVRLIIMGTFGWTPEPAHLQIGSWHLTVGTDKIFGLYNKLTPFLWNTAHCNHCTGPMIQVLCKLKLKTPCFHFSLGMCSGTVVESPLVAWRVLGLNRPLKDKSVLWIPVPRTHLVWKLSALGMPFYMFLSADQIRLGTWTYGGAQMSIVVSLSCIFIVFLKAAITIKWGCELSLV